MRGHLVTRWNFNKWHLGTETFENGVPVPTPLENLNITGHVLFWTKKNITKYNATTYNLHIYINSEHQIYIYIIWASKIYILHCGSPAMLRSDQIFLTFRVTYKIKFAKNLPKAYRNTQECNWRSDERIKQPNDQMSFMREISTDDTTKRLYEFFLILTVLNCQKQ